MAASCADFETRMKQRAGTLLSQRTASQRLVVSSKVWTNVIPTTDCDVVLTFKPSTAECDVMWLLSRLKRRSPGLRIHVRHHVHTEVYGFYLTAGHDTFLHGLSDLKLPKSLKRVFGGGQKAFNYDGRRQFINSDDDFFLTSQERQRIIRHILSNVRAEEGESLGKVAFHASQAIIPTLESRGIVDVIPLHSVEVIRDLKTNWVHRVLKTQPLDKVCAYFGVKIALYFAYLGHYTTFLVFPSVFGLGVWIYSGRNQFQDDVSFVLFSVVNVLWSTLYLEHWKRSSSELAYRWGTLDADNKLIVEPRPLFKGELATNPVTSRLEPYYPPWRRVLTYFVSVPVISLCLLVVLGTMLAIFELQEWINALIVHKHLVSWLRFLPKLLLVLCITSADFLYKKIALWLNNIENYREQERYEYHLILKLVLFQFVNSFLSLFYVAFYLNDTSRLEEQLATVFISRQIFGNIKEVGIPYIVGKVNLLRIGYSITDKMTPDILQQQFTEMIDTNVHGGTAANCQERSDSDKQDRSPRLTQAEVEAALKKYEDTYEDYLEMFVQFGYVMLFSPAFPLAAVCALLNNVIEIRSDAFKLCLSFQRPFGQSVQNIGIWQGALQMIVLIAILVNSLLMIGPLQRLLPHWPLAYIVGLVFTVEHTLLLFKYLISRAVSDVPHWVEKEKAKLEYARKEAHNLHKNITLQSVDEEDTLVSEADA